MYLLNKQRKRISHDWFLAGLILALAALQNGFFDSMVSIMGMDAISLLLSILIFFTFGVYFIRRKGYFPIEEIVLILFMTFLTVSGFIITKGSTIFLLNFRTLIYLVITFLFFKNIKMFDYEAIRLYRLAGLVNAVVCLIFYFQNVTISGFGFRDVSMNLYFSNFAILLCLFVNVKGENVILKWMTILFCMTAIFTSQQRTQIIPLFITFILYVLTNISLSNCKKIIRLIMIVVLIIIVYKIADNIGVLILVLNRLQMSNIMSQNDTLFVRFYDSNTAFSNMNAVNWLIGAFLTTNYRLEMLFPNLLFNYGVLGMLMLVFILFLKPLSLGCRYPNTYKRFFMLSFCIISVGGLYQASTDKTDNYLSQVYLV